MSNTKFIWIIVLVLLCSSFAHAKIIYPFLTIDDLKDTESLPISNDTFNYTSIKQVSHTPILNTFSYTEIMDLSQSDVIRFNISSFDFRLKAMRYDQHDIIISRFDANAMEIYLFSTPRVITLPVNRYVDVDVDQDGVYSSKDLRLLFLGYNSFTYKPMLGIMQYPDPFSTLMTVNNVQSACVRFDITEAFGQHCYATVDGSSVKIELSTTNNTNVTNDELENAQRRATQNVVPNSTTTTTQNTSIVDTPKQVNNTIDWDTFKTIIINLKWLWIIIGSLLVIVILYNLIFKKKENDGSDNTGDF